MLLEQRILDQRHVRRQHHQALARHILILLRTVPPPERPFLTQQQPEIIVRNHRWRERPGSFETRAIGVAAAEGVSTRKSDNLAVVETHAVEDGTQVRLLFGAVGKTPIGCARGDITVGTPWAPGDDGALHFLDGCDAGQRPEVRMGYPGELLLDGLEEVPSGFETGVGAVVGFRGETHGGAVGAASVGLLVVAGGMS